MMKKHLYRSMGLHVAVILALMINIPLFWFSRKTHISQVPIIVDLKDVKLSEMTNLPPKAKIGKEDKQASVEKRKEVSSNFTTPETGKKDGKSDVPAPKKEKTEEAPVKPKKDFMVAPQPSKPKTKPQPKPEAPKKVETKKGNNSVPAVKQEKGKPDLANPLKSLLASVDSIEKNLGPVTQEATVKEGTEVNHMGIEGGTGGSYFSELSISEIDAIAGRLRACWNLDPGAKGAQNMVVEIRAFLTPEGKVRDVKILDTGRYGSDPYFRSVAESARRAVYNCEDAYQIFVKNYSDKYDMWKTMLLKFNPLDGNIN
ncbi:MAG: hypothetical protein PHE89_07660 [Alphaproteobacteria bacterium]|nr:hypothetical protein [Alphaproteobacteria bacterium]